ncbi:MAG: biotin--[acetyl-CoA-carboxylase] ligase [Terriglobia bacterium]
MPRQATSHRLDRLIDLLLENATVVVPGPKIAAELRVPASTVWDWIERLRSMGVEIRGYPARGYQLQKLPDLLTPGLLRAELGECEIGKKIVHYFVAGSTNTEALRLAARGALHGTVVVAEEQTAGRGRLGRSWYSEKGSGIYASILLRPPFPPSRAPLLTLVAGISAHQAIAQLTDLKPEIRWPNDLLLGGKKVGGILTEMSAEVDRVHSVVLGIGLNVNHVAMPPALSGIASSLRIETGKAYSRVRLTAILLRETERFYRMLLDEGGGAIATRWEQASGFARGRRVRVLRTAGEAFGATEGLEPSGALRVRFDDGRVEALVSGEVIEVKQASHAPGD